MRHPTNDPLSFSRSCRLHRARIYPTDRRVALFISHPDQPAVRSVRPHVPSIPISPAGTR